MFIIHYLSCEIYFRVILILYSSFHTKKITSDWKTSEQTFFLNRIAFLFVIYNDIWFYSLPVLFLPFFKNYWLSYRIQISKWKIN